MWISGAYATQLSDEDFLKSIAKALKPGGVMSTPADSVWLKNFNMEQTIAQCRNIFKGSVNYAWTSVPSYPRQTNQNHSFDFQNSLLLFLQNLHFSDGFFPLLTDPNSAGRWASCSVQPMVLQSTSNTR